MKPNKPSNRRLRCTQCGERQAQRWGCSLGGYIFIHCPACNRELRSENIADIIDRKDGKALAVVRDKLLADWKAGGSTPSAQA